MQESGNDKFEEITKTKIKTEHGTVQKVHIKRHGLYMIDDEKTEYRINPKCYLCGEKLGCRCYSDDNSDTPFETAKEDLKKEWVCTKPECVIECFKRTSSAEYERLKVKYGDDIWAIVEEITENWDMDDEGEFCDYV